MRIGHGAKLRFSSLELHFQTLAPVYTGPDLSYRLQQELQPFPQMELGADCYEHVCALSNSWSPLQWKLHQLRKRLERLQVDLNEEKDQVLPKLRLTQTYSCHKIGWSPRTRNRVVALTPLPEMTRSASNSFLELSRPAVPPTFPGWATGSPKESETETQKPNDAFFMKKGGCCKLAYMQIQMATLSSFMQKLTKMKGKE